MVNGNPCTKSGIPGLPLPIRGFPLVEDERLTFRSGSSVGAAAGECSTALHVGRSRHAEPTRDAAVTPVSRPCGQKTKSHRPELAVPRSPPSARLIVWDVTHSIIYLVTTVEVTSPLQQQLCMVVHIRPSPVFSSYRSHMVLGMT